MANISTSAAPSHRSAAVVTGLVRSKVAKNEKNAFSSLRCASDMIQAAFHCYLEALRSPTEELLRKGLTTAGVGYRS